MSGDYLEERLGALLGRLATPGRGPGGGSAAALTIALAAGTIRMVARSGAGSWDEAGGLAAQADAIAERAGELAAADAEAWDAALAALREAEGEQGEDAR
ncbi:MAG TPA: cyclodeaminase/cyclohydrolase family protein, partial [Gaiellaceae bacterium]|nr:cyclodeaminase/cyclohydrolase family protein [Gaiellaceae bacterium]